MNPEHSIVTCCVCHHRDSNDSCCVCQSCWNCGRKASETCSGCNVARYCGSFCQHKDWENHHRVCGQAMSSRQRGRSNSGQQPAKPQTPTLETNVTTTSPGPSTETTSPSVTTESTSVSRTVSPDVPKTDDTH